MSVVAVGQEWMVELYGRRDQVRAILGDAGCDAGLVFGCAEHAQTFRYLTNFAPVLGDMWLVLGDGDRCVLTFTWQLDEARSRSGIERWEGAFDPVPLVIDALAATGARRIGVDGMERMPLPAYRALVEALPGVELVDVAGPVARLRRRKSALEVEMLRRACGLTDRMLDAARAGGRPGVTETELAASLSSIPLAAGGGLAFDSTVIGGVDEPIPIRRPTGRAFRSGDTVMVDIGAELEGYQADASRTFVLGAPSAEQRRAWDTVRRAYDAVLDLVRPGVPCRELHRVSSRIIEDAGYRVAHRIGHGFGLATSFEWPSLDVEPAPLEPGMTICVEPGVYAPGAGNVKIEDDLLVTEDGYELLTRSDATLEVRA